MERALMRLMRSQAQAWRVSSSSSSSSSSSCVQRGVAALSTLRQYDVSSSVSSSPPRAGGFSRSELRGYADSSAQKEDVPLGNVEVLEFGTHRTTTGKRFAVGTTAVDVDEVQDLSAEEEIKEKAKEVLQEVVEKIDEIVEEAQVRELQEKLVRTEGMGEVVQELYNKPDIDEAEVQTGATTVQ